MEQYVCMAGTKAVVTLPCGHEYCRSCIWGWLKDHVTCPVCRWRFPDSDTHLLT
jgi:E3 ubiquitin-protein ligase SHPRH